MDVSLFDLFASPRERHYSGPRLSTAEAVTAELAKTEPVKHFESFCGAPLGPIILPTKRCFLGGLWQGAPGAGKSLLVKLLLATTLRYAGRGHRFFVFDPAGAYVDLAAKFTPKRVRIANLDFFAEAGCGLDFGWVERGGTAECRQMAHTLIPNPTGGDRFWTDSARIWLTDILDTRRRAGKKITLRWLLQDSASTNRIEAVVRHDAELFAQYEKLLGVEKMADSIVATIQSALKAYSEIAGGSDAADFRLDLERLVEHSCQDVVIIPLDHARVESLVPLVSLFFRTVTDYILRYPDDSVLNWLVFDEATTLAKLGSSVTAAIDYPRIQRLGRKSGCALFLAVHDPADLELAVGDRESKVLLGLLQAQIFLSPGLSRTAAKYAAEACGRQTVLRYTYGSTYSESGTQTSQSEQFHEQDVVSVDDLLALPVASRANGLAGYGRVAGLNPFAFKIDMNRLLRAVDAPKVYERKLRSPDALDLTDYEGF